MADTPLKFAVISVFENKADTDNLAKYLLEEQCELTEISSVSEMLGHVINESRTDLIIVESALLRNTKSRELRILSERINARKIPVIIIADNEDHEALLSELDFETVDLLFKPLYEAVIRSKVALFKKVLYYKTRLIETIEEKKYVNAQFQHFIHVIAHDLKSPLSSAVFLLSILKDDPRIRKIDDIGEYVQNIYASNIHMADMITLIADYIRESLSEQQIEIVDTKELILQIINNDEANKNINFQIEGQLPSMRTKKYKLQHVFKMLIEQISNHKSPENNHIRFGVNEKNNHYEFYIKYKSDNVSDYKKTFTLSEKPYRMDNHETNINLNTLKLLVEEQWGKIWTVSTDTNERVTYFEWRK